MSSDKKQGLIVETYMNHVYDGDLVYLLPEDSLLCTGTDGKSVQFVYSKDGKQIDIYWNIDHVFAKFMHMWINFLHNTDLYKFTQHVHELHGLRIVGHYYYDWFWLSYTTAVEEFLPGESILCIGAKGYQIRKHKIELSEDGRRFTIYFNVRNYDADHKRLVLNPKEPAYESLDMTREYK